MPLSGSPSDSLGDTVHFGLTVPGLAFGMWIIDSDINTPGDSIVVDFIGENNQSLTYELQAGPVVSGGTETNLVFFGVVIDPQYLARITSVTMNEVGGDYDNVSVGAVTFGSQVVPEPATMSLLGIGGVVALIRRRRRRK